MFAKFYVRSLANHAARGSIVKQPLSILVRLQERCAIGARPGRVRDTTSCRIAWSDTTSTTSIFSSEVKIHIGFSALVKERKGAPPTARAPFEESRNGNGPQPDRADNH